MLAARNRDTGAKRSMGSGRAVRIPVYGSIPAGPPEERHEAQGYIATDLEMLGIPKLSARVFAVRVKDDALRTQGIHKGDWAIVQHAKEPRDGSIIAAYVNGEGTLGTFVLKNRKPFLRLETPRGPELIPAQDLMIQGVLIGLYRRAD